MKFRTPAPSQLHCKVTAIFPSSVAVAVSPYCWLFLCSDHRLRIEVGRREKILAEERKCLMCNENVIEDEQHFLTTCPEYGTLRTQLYEKIGHSVPNFNSLSAEKNLINMMSSESSHTVQWVACFIKSAFETRSTPSTT